jgi:hypothetical protein
MTASNASAKNASDGKEARRRRFAPGAAKYAMTPGKAELLAFVAECGLLTTGQVARIAGISKKAAYNRLRDLYDLGLLGRIAVPYASLAPPGADGPGLAWGPGENVHVPTRDGIKWLVEAGYLSEEEADGCKTPDFGPRNALFLAHEVLVREVRVWLELCARTHGGQVVLWVDGEAAHFSTVRPDAWFLFALPSGKTLVGLVEADRGTERGDRWLAKADGYAQLLGSDELADATGGRRNARLVAVALDEARRDRITRDLGASPIAASSYVATVEDLREGGLSSPVWRSKGKVGGVPLVMGEL